MLKNKRISCFKCSGFLFVCLLFFINNLAIAAKSPESAADFFALKGESFKVVRIGKGNTAWSKSVDLKLVDVSDTTKIGPTEQFTVRFRAAKKDMLEKAVYHFEHIKTGEFSLFLESAKSDKKNNYYQATFNLLK